MKELSIEEKAKRYDDLLVKLQEAKVDNNVCDERYCCVIDDIVPELKESEDEKIVNYLEGIIINDIDTSDAPFTKKAILSCLEKMKSNPYTGVGFKYNGQTWDMCARDEGVDILVDSKLISHIDIRQGEQKPVPKFKVGDIVKHKDNPYLTYILKRFTDDGDYEFHAIGKDGNEGCTCFSVVKYQDEWELVEQKPTIIPKFKVGDWIVIDGEVLHVKEVTEDGYLTDEGGLIPFRNEKEAHIWSIADAKDGDVLCTYECGKPKIVFILKGAPEKPYVLGYHCFYNIMYPHFEFDSEKGCLAPNEENVKPATKEQRDTLMKAMADAGYTFDFEKKELKKIEQNSAWSEEDEEYLKAAIWYAENPASNVAKNAMLVEWLKNLKGRVQPQPKQEWDGGDEAHRPQMQWKAVDKEIYVKEPALAQRKDKSEPNHGYVICYDHTLTPDVYERFIMISDIYNQSHWKNSDEQIKVMTKIKAGIFYMCLKDISGYDSFTKGKVYSSIYDNALINDNHIEVKVMNSEYFRIASDKEIFKAKLDRLKEETYIGLSEHDNGVKQGRMEVISALYRLLDSMKEKPTTSVWHDISEEANLSEFVILYDEKDGYMSPPCRFPFKDMSGFVDAMNRKYGAHYTKWAYKDDLLKL